MSKEKSIKQFKKFIKSIKPTDRVAVIHHEDCDGICSGHICVESLVRLGHKVVLAEGRAANALNFSLVRKLGKKEVTKAIFVDLAFDQYPEVAEKLGEFCDIIIIDHHKIYNDIQTAHVTTIKHTHLDIKVYYPASKLAYDLFSEVADIKDLDWVAAVGLVGDSGYHGSKKFVNNVMKKYNIFPAQDLFTTDIGKAANYINSASVVVPGKMKLAMRVLKEAKAPKDVFRGKLERIVKKVNREKDRKLKLFKQNAEEHGDLMMGEVNSRYKIKSSIISALSFDEYPDRTIIIFQRSGDKYLISARRQDRKLAVNNLLERATASFEDARGGGHEPAAGGFIRAKDFEEFKIKLIAEHKKMRNN